MPLSFYVSGSLDCSIMFWCLKDWEHLSHFNARLALLLNENWYARIDNITQKVVSTALVKSSHVIIPCNLMAAWPGNFWLPVYFMTKCLGPPRFFVFKVRGCLVIKILHNKSVAEQSTLSNITPLLDAKHLFGKVILGSFKFLVTVVHAFLVIAVPKVT